MNPSTDNAHYADAAARHWEGAEVMLVHAHLPNADHLFGVSAECSLKSVMVALGLPIGPAGSVVAPVYRVHIDRLWPAFVTFASGVDVTDYAALLGAESPFNDWRVEQRYAHRQWFDSERVAAHRSGSLRARTVLASATLDGLLT